MISICINVYSKVGSCKDRLNILWGVNVLKGAGITQSVYLLGCGLDDLGFGC